MTILSSSYFGFPLSTTQVIAGGVTGTGLGRSGGIVHWRVVRKMIVAWGLTLPAAGLTGAAAYGGVRACGGGIPGVVVVCRDRDRRPERALPALAPRAGARGGCRRAACPAAGAARRAGPADPGAGRMILATFRDYVDPDALWRILAVTLLASVLVPVAFAAAITGQGRRDAGGCARRQRRPGHGDGRSLGAFVCVAAIVLGIWAMLQK